MCEEKCWNIKLREMCACVFVRESEAADAVWKMHVCTRARFKGGERDRAEQQRLVREWELQTERQRRVLDRAETGSTRQQHVCFYLTTLGSPRTQLPGCCCCRLVCRSAHSVRERLSA